MKKLSNLLPNCLLLGALGLGMASCSNDMDMPVISSGDGNFSITVNFPESYKATRAAITSFGTATVADQLNIAVYDAVSGNLVQEGLTVFPTGSLSTTVDFNLVRGKSYNIAFFAQSKESMNSADDTDPSNAVYTFNAEEGTMTVNYANMTSENNLNDAYDCFYNVMSTGVIGSNNVTTSIILNRPVGQVNFGTDDLTYNDQDGVSQDMVAAHDDAYGSNGQYIQTNLQVSKPYTVLNLLTGAVSGNDNNATIGVMAAPYTFTFPLTTSSSTLVYKYVAMSYILAPSDNSTVYDLNLTINNNLNPNLTDNPNLALSNLVPVSGAPVQANFQTNIYGNLLSDDVTVTVTKNQNWDINSPFNVEQGVSEPTFDEASNTYSVSTQAELNWLAEQVNNNGETFAGKTVTLLNDIYMTGLWTPIGQGTVTTEANNFAGEFDGNGKTIYNLTVNAGNSVGFIGNLTGIVKNLNFENASITGNHWGGVVVGFADNETGSTVISGCNVSNSSVTLSAVSTSTGWDDGDKVGIIVGYMADGSETISGNTVTNCSIKGYRDLGGIVGYLGTGNTVTNNTVNGLNILIDNTHNYNNYQTQDQYDAAAIVGEGTVGTGNTSSNVTISMFSLPSAGSGNVYTAEVSSMEALAEFAAMIPNDFSSKTVNISFPANTTLDFGNQPFTAVNLFRSESTTNFDFNYATFKNVTLSAESPNIITQLIGTAKNLTIEGLTADFSDTGRSFGVFGEVWGTLENITVNNVNINVPNYNVVGAIVGLLDDQANISGCSVSTGSITGDAAVGGMIGVFTGGNITNCNVSGLTINGTTTPQPGSNYFSYYTTGSVQAGAVFGGILAQSPSQSLSGQITNTSVNGVDQTNPTVYTNFGYTWNSTTVSAEPVE